MDKTKILRKLERRSTKIPGGRWLWNGAKYPGGYGMVRFNGKLHRANRLSAYIFHEFDLESSLLVLHKNICPNKSCWNPEHLYVGDTHDNLTDWQRLRIRTKCRNGHSVNYKNQVCLVCNRARNVRYRARIKSVNERR